MIIWDTKYKFVSLIGIYAIQNFNNTNHLSIATGSRTTIYNVLENGDPNDGCDPTINEVEQQFLIKWKNWANIHNTWETYENLKEQKVNGLKKLENYLKNLNEINEW